MPPLTVIAQWTYRCTRVTGIPAPTSVGGLVDRSALTACVPFRAVSGNPFIQGWRPVGWWRWEGGFPGTFRSGRPHEGNRERGRRGRAILARAGCPLPGGGQADAGAASPPRARAASPYPGQLVGDQ